MTAEHGSSHEPKALTPEQERAKRVVQIVAKSKEKDCQPLTAAVAMSLSGPAPKTVYDGIRELYTYQDLRNKRKLTPVEKEQYKKAKPTAVSLMKDQTGVTLLEEKYQAKVGKSPLDEVVAFRKSIDDYKSFYKQVLAAGARPKLLDGSVEAWYARVGDKISSALGQIVHALAHARPHPKPHI